MILAHGTLGAMRDSADCLSAARLEHAPHPADSLGMMRPSLAAAALAVSALTGCGIADFDIDQAVPSQTIQGSGVPTPIAAVFPLPLSLDIGSKIKSRETGPIDSVTLKRLELTITSTTGDWGFVDHIDVYVESTKDGSTLPKVLIASVDNPPATQGLSFVVEDDVNLKDYVDEGAKVDSSGTGTQPTADVTFNGTSTFTIHPF